VLDNVRSLNNVGSVFRTADAFGLEAVYLCGITAQPPHRDITKTALGATESVEWKHFEHPGEALKQLKEAGCTILALEQAHGSESLENFQFAEGAKYALVIGHEVKGVGEELVEMADNCLEIPQFGTKHSLNVSVSTGIAVWEIFKKWKWPRP
jgi:tRNA G18 (ribose-2'-O)-methylase SpoU